ncbi:hypothetical protein M378DRAFT_169794 [Amanita muscaria Koide BX008]|uniref:Mug135-like C-terminal domain-containing protein n=1 Tax=Amanita muscaria (strain Koide BX008) TaxID=946122 RepID=A0A0C2WS39_AMAMK|nr:hypothetical protein M378DRAFT_169794 [Amanita muscaria Koide BX008]
MPIQLPPPPTGRTPLPAPPQDPPTLRDISDARSYNRNIQISRDQGIATHADVAQGMVYEAALVAHHVREAIVPAWFVPALAQGLAPVTRIASKTYNLQAGTGRERPFQIVPFPNGTLPTAPPHNLPALTNVDAIDALTARQCARYLRGYNIAVPATVQERRTAIKLEIGYVP